MIKNNKYIVAIAKAVAALTLLTLVSAISVHYLTGNTLSEYAEQNPELAYGIAVESIPDDSGTTSDPRATSDSGIADAGISETNTSDSNITDPTVTDNDINSNAEVPNTSDSTASDTDLTNIVASDSSDPFIHFYYDEPHDDSRQEIADGFYYETLSDTVKDYITGISYPDNNNEQIAINYDDLAYLGLKYIDYDGNTRVGELISNKAIAKDLIEIFYELYEADYQFESIYLIDNFDGDDTVSMEANNTSCFNYRVVDGKSHLSQHAYGRAIDINPFYNPYLVYNGNDDGTDYISPSGSEIYIDRSSSFPYKIDHDDLCYKLFKEHGFTWGGDWNSVKDYQHFQKK